MYRARDKNTAEMLDKLREISIDLSFSINPDDGILLRQRLQNTSFKELIDIDPNILAWNYDKGREIGIKMYDSTGNIYSSNEILSSLFHELAHSLMHTQGHANLWKMKDEYLQTFVPKYVNILIIKT